VDGSGVLRSVPAAHDRKALRPRKAEREEREVPLQEIISTGLLPEDAAFYRSCAVCSEAGVMLNDPCTFHAHMCENF